MGVKLNPFTGKLDVVDSPSGDFNELELNAGTAGEPSIAFSGDSNNTGIYSPGLDQLAISTNGSERLRITSDGKVGLGTSSPDELLHIEGDTAEFKGTNTNPVETTVGTEQVFKFGIEGQKNGVYGPVGSIIFRQDELPWSITLPNYKPTRLEFCTQDSTDTDKSETPRLVIDRLGRVGIGTTSPDALLDVENSSGAAEVQIKSLNASDCTLAFGDNADTDVGRIRYAHSADAMLFFTAASERLRIDSSGRLLVGTSSSSQIGSTNSAIQVRGTGPDNAGLSISRFSDNGASGYLSIGKARGSIATPVIVDDDDIIGTIQFAAYDGGDLATSAAEITAEVDGTPGANDMPGRLVFSTTADGASSPTERMRIDSSGNVGIGTMPNVKLEIGLPTGVSQVNSNALRINRGVTGQYAEFSAASGAAFINGVNGNGGGIRFLGDGNERARIDTSGRLLVGTSTARTSFYNGTGLSSTVQFEATHASPGTQGRFVLSNNTTGSQPFEQIFVKSGAATAGSHTLVADDDRLGLISFQGTDGSEPIAAVSIEAHVDGTPGANDMPGRLVFSTTADGASTPTARMTIKNDGNVGIGTESPAGKLQIATGASGGNVLIDAEASSAYHAKVVNGSGDLVLGSRNTTADTFLVSNRAIRFEAGSSETEAARIDSSGRLLVGTSSSNGGTNNTTELVVDGGMRSFLSTSSGNTTFTPSYTFQDGLYAIAYRVTGQDKGFIGYVSCINGNATITTLTDRGSSAPTVVAGPQIRFPIPGGNYGKTVSITLLTGLAD